MIQSGAGNYLWIEDWVRIPRSAHSEGNGRTHAVVVSREGKVLVFHQASPAVLVFDADGTLLTSWGDYPGAHGMTLVEEDGTEFLWLTDQETKQVVKTTLAGKKVLALPRPDHPVYREQAYIPTWVAVNEKRHQGNGDVWVADGYGSHFVHRFDSAGHYLMSINGGEGQAGPFHCPHGIWIGHRQGKISLYVADRGNRRIQVFDAEGNYRKHFGGEFLTSPDGFAACKEWLVVPELQARVTILDANDKPLCRLGENDAVSGKEGWPNSRDLIQPGKFNSPHGAGVDAQGNIYVAEWITGGRIIQLKKQL